MEHTFEEPSPAHQHFSPPQEHAQGHMSMDDLLQLVHQLMTRTDSLEKDLKQTKLTMGSAIVKLVKKVKKLEGILKRRNVVLSDSKEEEPEDQGRKSQDDPLVSLVQGLPKSIDKGRRYKRRKETKGKKVVTSLDFQEEVSTGYAEGVNTGSIKAREGKAPMIIEEAFKKTKEQILQEEASLAEAIRLDTLDKEEEAKQSKGLKANAELSKSVLGSGLQGEDFAKKMVELGTWKLSQLKNLSFEEVKEEFDKLVKQVESFAPINFEATKDSLKRFGEELQTKTSKILKSDEAKDEESIKKTGKRRKKMLILFQGRMDDIVYINFGAMLKDITRDDITELYRIVMNRYGMTGPEDEFEKVLWEYLKNIVHCLNLESMDLYMLIERKYPLSAEVCKAMLEKKLQGGKPDENCYKMLKMMEKQAGIRKHKDWLVQEQMALGKDFSNPLMADNLPKIVWLSKSSFLVGRVASPHVLRKVKIEGNLRKLEVHSEDQLGEDCMGNYIVKDLILKKNQGTVTRIKTDDNGVFEMLFIAIGASIRTFLNYLLPVLMIDAAHLKGLYKGTNLVAVAMDGNNQIVPIAFGICKGETGPCWSWWMSVLKECIGDNPNLLFISDRHAAIALAVEK
ncbi:transposase, MuDR, MULE transposase domain protein [Tanacetum coccineum]|uniref:Transposase, MuDR, MULE transposase domain protein n=1 Tax=Tanacetum coccineum TaxID=301880 RepID=A0ABQ5H033_9ASTR